MSIFHPLEVVNRGSETQLQVGEKLIDLIQRIEVEWPRNRHNRYTMYKSSCGS